MARNETYEEFVEKFKPKKTTDDCYTPSLVYNAVVDWAVREYNLYGREIMRPFYPGGDYEQQEYPENCVVIDNPPFSILSEILKFYRERGIAFFLFCPHLTQFSTSKTDYNNIVTHAQIVYENGAKVPTSFITNLGDVFLRTAPELKRAVESASDMERLNRTKKVPKYKYPPNVISSALLGKITEVDFEIKSAEEVRFIRVLDAQRESGKDSGIFGGGLLISDKAAAELRAAELRAAELRAARESTEWQLSEKERAIIEELNKKA